MVEMANLVHRESVRSMEDGLGGVARERGDGDGEVGKGREWGGGGGGGGRERWEGRGGGSVCRVREGRS